ncbi:MAG: endolytic transglycosylase MltG [Gammaproteobacteria bacterium]|nr:endolytic transglycosylase MltG [Gammaproteobacteria bacterium]MCH9744753.1 endolytic transglycosylase MltG [Gammaproteobacteria bacterium]
MSRRVAQILTILGVVCAFVLVWFVWMFYQFSYRPLRLAGVTSVKVYPNTGIKILAKRLYSKNLIKHPTLFTFFAEFRSSGKHLRFGEYRIRPGMSARNLLDNIMLGKNLVKHRVTLIEGWTFRNIMQHLQKDPNLRNTLNGLTAQQIMAKVDPAQKHPEGLIFPDTYTFTWGNTDLDVLKRGYQRMQNIINSEWPQRSKNLPYRDAYKALIVASMVEKEAAVANERDKIAGVIVRRLKKRMRLQIDPTVLYGLQKPYGSVITKRDLRTKTPYNTYRHYGLPPTPIAMPSKASIIAALHPSSGTALFYVSRGDGTHIFSDTYRGHLLAVNQYQRGSEHQRAFQLKDLDVIPGHLRRAPLIEFASYILCFMCL